MSFINPSTPYRCPFCAKGEGFVRKVGIKDEIKTLTYCCDACNRTWELMEPSESKIAWLRPESLPRHFGSD